MQFHQIDKEIMNPRDHQLFKQYPLNGTAAISTGEVPTPYHIYDGYGLFIGGVSDSAAVKHLLKDESLVPIQTSDGKTVMGIWVCNFSDASLGPHHELQFSFFVSERETSPIAAHPLNTLVLMLTRPDVRMLCFGLWNNTPNVVAYNRELLSLNARQTGSRIEREARQVRFQFKDTTTNELIFSGEINHPQQASRAATLSLMSKIGMRGTLAVARQPWLSMRILNPLGIVLNRNAIAEAFTKNDANVARYFDRQTDHLEFGNPAYGALHFSPQCVQYMAGFKFVYLQPT